MLRGYLVKDGLWDRYVFGSARSEALGKVTSNLRAISVAGGMYYTAHRYVHAKIV